MFYIEVWIIYEQSNITYLNNTTDILQKTFPMIFVLK